MLCLLSLLLTSFLIDEFAETTHSCEDGDAWGFYGHRKINRMAVFTLPSEMLKFYKKHIEFVTEHAVDPDKRRYAIKQEAVRHYIDIDHWGVFPFDDLPRNYAHSFWKYADISIERKGELIKLDSLCFDASCYQDSALVDFFWKEIYPDQGDASFDFEYRAFKDQANALNLKRFDRISIVDEFSTKGILPYQFPLFYKKLVRAFESRNTDLILKYSAEIGHYIGDAHVPLHTTENYNGQLTDQLGIHAFWESRIPELFADESYDFFVGRCEYISDVPAYIWDVIFDSHQLLDSVLLIEKRLTESFPEDQQFCFDERLERTVRVECRAFAEAYQNAMNGMVEARMQDAILSLGNIWFSAWMDGGQPDLDLLDLTLTEAAKAEQDALNKQYRGGVIYGREH